MFNTKKISIPLLSLFTLLSSQVHAAPYVSAQVGVYGTGIEDSPYSDKSDSVRATGRLSAGYLWEVNSYTQLGVETGFQAYQNTDESLYQGKLKTKRNTLDLLGVVDVKPFHKVNLFAKAGPAFVMQKETVDFYDEGYSAHYENKDNVIVPKGVIGVGYDVSNKLNVNLSLNHEFKKSSDSHFASSGSSVLAGVTYRL